MPNINLELQLKFLNELDDALKDALERYHDESDEKLAELKYMQREVTRARRIIAERATADEKRSVRRSAMGTEMLREAAV
ncbi:MAG: hypothetical protein EP335_01100 [Alphaproteobacteria bacterium]|nr:MAG: hypothetical protein EP335_01100 [Alphaproteobacteria bacterium]